MKATVEVWMWIVAGIIAGLLILTLAYSYSLQMTNTVTEQSVLEQYDELYTQTNELCWSYLGNRKESNLILNKNTLGIYATNDHYAEYDNNQLIDYILEENTSSGNFLCIKIKNKKTICKELDCNARMPFLGAVPMEFSLTSLINNLKGNPESFEYNLIPKRDKYGVNMTKSISNPSERKPEDPDDRQDDKEDYIDKQVFLVSDEDWRTVLNFVPVAIWTKGTTIEKYPLLIYHKEGSAFDADSVIHFFQQYQPSKVVIVGTTPAGLDNLLVAQPPLGAGILPANIVRIQPENHLDYWKTISKVVVVRKDNYDAGLMGSVYASYINSPILFLDSANLQTHKKYLDNNKVYLIGAQDSGVENYIKTNAASFESLTIEQLEKKYVVETGTDKMIIVNPEDLGMWDDPKGLFFYKPFKPDKSSNNIDKTYIKTSLSAPILAAGKHEVIVRDNSNDWSSVDNTVETKISDFGFSNPYLTIVASPNAIPLSVPIESQKVYTHVDFINWIEADGRIYGSKNNYGLIDYPTGRIFSLTPSGVSAYMARSLFFEDLEKDRDISLFITELGGGIGYFYWMVKSWSEANFWTPEIQAEFIDDQELHYGDMINPRQVEQVKQKYDEFYLLLYIDHGSETSFSALIDTKDLVQNKMYLEPMIVFDIACSTCNFHVKYDFGDNMNSDLFCAQNIRRGAMVFQGAVDTTYSHCMFKELMERIFLKGKTVGEAYKEARNLEITVYCDINIMDEGIKGDPFYALIGDPTFKPKYW